MTRIALLGLLAALFLLPYGCRREPVAGESDEVCVSLALSVPGSPTLRTKMTDDIVQKSTPLKFRGIEHLYAVPFTDSPLVLSNSQRQGANLSLTSIADSFADTLAAGLIRNNNAHLFDNVYIRRGIASVLVYGVAKPETGAALEDPIAYKRRNGVIVPANLDVNTLVQTASQITFSLESIVTGSQAAFTAWKTDNLALLNAIASASASTASFKDPSTYGHHAGMTAVLNAYTGSGQTFSCADEVVSRLLTNLYNDCYSYSVAPGETQLIRDLATAVRTAISSRATGENPTLVITNPEAGSATVQLKSVSLGKPAPSCYGLPAGAVTLNWDNSNLAFVLSDQAEGVVVAAADVYCYPPALWYFVNSPLMTTSNKGVVNAYSKNSANWKAISSQYAETGVKSNTKAAAVRDSLQYAVALMDLFVNKSALTSLTDYAGTQVSIDNGNFPLTGVVVASQRTQAFDFTNSGTGTMQFIYDTEVNKTDGSPKAWITHQTSLEPQSIYTLCFSTAPGEDVNFALEFQNNSGATFRGARNCSILPGSKFYMIGSLIFADATNRAQHPELGSVFVKDHTTTVTASFSSLALAVAYDTLPDLKAPDLQFGVSADLSWDLTTPGTVVIR